MGSDHYMSHEITLEQVMNQLREEIKTLERLMSGRLAEINRLGDELDKDDATVKRLRTALMMLKPEYFQAEKQVAAAELIEAALRGEE